jgi:hypothetical protein
MQCTTETDVWVVARIAALERANRRLWIGLSALVMAFVTLLALAGLLAATFELPASVGGRAERLDAGSIRANDVAVTGTLRVVDEEGRDLVWIGREPGTSGARAADRGRGVLDQTRRRGRSRRCVWPRRRSAPRSRWAPDGASSASLFVAADGASLGCARAKSRVVSESRGVPAARVAASPAPRPRPPRPDTGERRPRAEAPAIWRGGAAGARHRIDLTDGVLQPLGQDFYVGRLALRRGGGLRVTGRIVNAGSVDQLRVEFRLSVASRELPFSVARVGAGSSTPFALEIPKATNAELRDARIRWVRSLLNYGTE